MDIVKRLSFVGVFLACISRVFPEGDVAINQTLLKCIPEEIRGTSQVKLHSSNKWYFDTYFLPLEDDYHSFKITEMDASSPGFVFMECGSSTSFRERVEQEDVKTDKNFRYTYYTIEKLVAGRLYHFRFVHKSSVKLVGMEYTTNKLLKKLGIWTNMTKQTIIYEEQQAERLHYMPGEWQQWSPCSQSCGGTKVRHRSCLSRELSLTGKMRVPSSEMKAPCQSNVQNISCTGVRYYSLAKGSSCKEKCTQEGRLCAQYGAITSGRRAQNTSQYSILSILKK